MKDFPIVSCSNKRNIYLFLSNNSSLNIILNFSREIFHFNVYPVVFLIDRRSVKSRLEIVKPKDAASNHSIEYIIRDLKWNEFEMIKIKDILAGVISPVEG